VLDDALDGLASRVSCPDRLLREAFDAVTAHVPNVGGVLYAYDAAGRYVTLGGALADATAHADPELFRPANDPSHRLVLRLAPRPRVVRATADVSRRTFHRSPAYRGLYREHGVEHITCAWIDGRRPFSPGMRGLMLARGADQGELDETELAALQRGLPLLTRAASRIDAGDREGEGARLRVDDEGRPTHVPVELEATLARFEVTPDELLDRVGPPVRRWRALRRRLGLDRLAGSERLFQLVERDGRTLYVEVTEAEGGFALRLRDPRAVTSLAELRTRLGLTPAEIHVLQALGLGLSNVEIAGYLCLSAETVKTHVTRLLRKLGVSSRLQAGLLVQRILLE